MSSPYFSVIFFMFVTMFPWRGWVMNRRTPRRRISPRTVKRYRAIKNFVRRALGSPSRPDIQTNSSISVSVLDLRQKIDGIEQQLNTVSKHCQDLATFESRLKLKENLDSQKDSNTDTPRHKVLETEGVYNTLQDPYDKPVVNDKSTSKEIICDSEARIKLNALNKMVDQNYSYNYKEIKKNKFYHKLDPIEENEQTLRRRRNRMATSTLPADLPMYRSHSFNEPRNCTRHLDNDYSEVHRQKNRKKVEYLEANDRLARLNNHKEFRYEDHKNHRNKYVRPTLDQDFITDIIRRQYRPVKLFGRRESDFSQFSAPVCRDQEFPITETVQEGSDLCSCCRKEHRQHRQSRYMCSNDLSDIRSICDTRLYGSRKPKRHTNHRERANDFYNDAAMYDVIPVKEKSSPKSRRKFVEENMSMYNNYREVPPSPRTQRPRLNLKAQFHTDDENVIPLVKQLKQTKRLQRKSFIQNEENVSNISSDVFIHNRNFKCTRNQITSNNVKSHNEECVGTMNTLQYPILSHEQCVINNDTTLNTQTTDVSADKTDKTLSEIKDILQNFLQEIKKEASQSEQLNNSPQLEVPQNTYETQQQYKSNSCNTNNNFGQCGMPTFVQSFPNSCCYPILPVCPINCMQNGFMLPSPSFTCAACTNNSKERNCGSNDFKNKTNGSEETNSETQKLIKEIHNLISQHPTTIQKKEFRNNNKLSSRNERNEEIKPLTSRSIGGSSKASKHDAKVGTRQLKCHSKSCEAIGSREATYTQHVTNASYSDTVLEKGSGEEITTESISESEYSSDATVMDKKKGNKFTKILRSIGILKRNKVNDIEEVTESESSMDLTKPNVRSPFQPHPKSPFQQHIINYNMHGQEYFQPPMTSHQHQYECCGHSPQYNTRTCYSPMNVDNNINNSLRRRHKEYNVLTHCPSPHHVPIPTCTKYYDPQYANLPPQVPVCLKEIEVKSIGTQSVRKMSLLQKFTNKMQVPAQRVKEASPKQSSTQASSKDKNWRHKPEPNLFDWKKIHEKAMQKTTDPLKFSFTTQKKLAEGDNTMRNVMLKKLFYKRNPFSPRNLLVRTLLGKDRSSFGEPPKMYKPKMFL